MGDVARRRPYILLPRAIDHLLFSAARNHQRQIVGNSAVARNFELKALKTLHERK
jgi:hypothetical protein